jgi:hypothetical protein
MDQKPILFSAMLLRRSKNLLLLGRCPKTPSSARSLPGSARPPKSWPLVTLQDAGEYITKLPEAEHKAAEWQAAMEALILVATSGGPTMFARIGVMRALNRNVERTFNPSRKDPHWGKRKLKRDQ